MDFDKLTALAYEMMGQRKSHLRREVGFVYYHGQRTAKLVITLRRAIFPDRAESDDVLVAAAMFHDVGKGMDPHSRYGALIAREALAGKGLMTDREVDDVTRIISVHEFRGDPTRPWDELLFQDADLLDHFGTYDLWMSVQYQAHTDGSMGDMLTRYRDEYPEFLDEHRALLNFDQTIAAYDARNRECGRIIARMAAENEGEM